MRFWQFVDQRRLQTAILALAFACSDPARLNTTALSGEWLSLGLGDRAVRCLAIVGSRLYAGSRAGSLSDGPGDMAVHPGAVDEHLISTSCDSARGAVNRA